MSVDEILRASYRKIRTCKHTRRAIDIHIPRSTMKLERSRLDRGNGRIIKLTDLNPQWIIGYCWKESDEMRHFCGPKNTQGRYGMGISFDCPFHRTHRITVFFANPLDGLPPAHCATLWRRTYKSFELLTLKPTVDVDRTECWNGCITCGEIA